MEPLNPRFLEWLFSARPTPNEEFARQYCAARRVSCRQLPGLANLPRWQAQRERLRVECLLPMLRNFRYSVFFKLDLESTARIFAGTPLALPPRKAVTNGGLEPLQEVHDQMFRAAVLRHRHQKGWEKCEANAFQRLREMIVRDAQLSPALPRPSVQEDQIVWGRSPVRLDLAGGWTDTPPYCLEYGGRVINVAADLNGQPPIQVFARLSEKPEVVLRSIDLGVEQRIATYDQLDTFAMPGSGFALAKAALALAGFLPRFHTHAGFSSLKRQLTDFGGGIELSLLSAVPKGSGLGTSSILAATLLATLNDLCGLGWDRNVLFTRTPALEQMLTTGGGWQDQAGAIFGGVKLIETGPGLQQKPTIHWLPPQLFDGERANQTILLYYTGITRLAKNILQEIVRGIFLNSPSHLRVVEAIGANAEKAFQAIQACDYGHLAGAIARSWQLNQELDRGTNPPEVQAILRPIARHLAGAKLLGAGGGGYLLMLANDEQAAVRIRQILQARPTNPRARFVQFALSPQGLQVTRS
jgi:galactokinase/mevalonate kinase-like predicted kinase